MATQVGQRLGPYEILSAIGAGGMGEVYRARDTRLDRIVAIKVLPDHLSDKPDLRERFEREARTIASLNHAHICTLHDIGHQDGTDYLVMEYLEGETLAERLKKGPLPLDQVLRYAIDIADALDKAHRKGIIHRDLKPGNILLTKSGAKLLDFGLAKLTQEATPAASISRLPTQDNLTEEGTILGTYQYMAPEQVEAKGVDARTDIFAFGAVVYEMATGKKAFQGKTQASIMAKILESEPPSISSLQPMSPLALDRVVKKCLAKDADDRWQSAHDVTDELKWIAEGGSDVVLAAPLAAHKRRKRMLSGTAAIGVAAVIALSIPAIMRLRETPTAAPEMRVDIMMPATADPVSFAISPDGRQLVFVAAGDGSPRLWLRPLDAVKAQPLAGTEGASLPFWSPDSRSVGFLVGNQLKRVDIGGGLPQTLTNNANSFSRGTWSPDGVILFTITFTRALFRIPASGGEPVAVTKLDPPRQTGQYNPQFLPGGRQFLFYATGQADAQGIYLGSLDAPETKRLTAADTAGLYAPSGWLFYIRQGTLVARRFDPLRGELTGDSVTVADPVGFDATRFVGAFSVSAAGPVIYRSASGGIRRQLTWFDRSGKVLGTVGAPDENDLLDPALSPDGRRVAVDRFVQGNRDIWIIDGVRTTRFTFDAGADTYPTWSPDGSQIAFRSDRKGVNNIYLKPSSGAGNEELVWESPLQKIISDWSRDGRFLFCMVDDPKTGRDIWVLPLEGDRKPRVFLSTNFLETGAHFSPDGRWASYQSDESGRTEIYVRPISGSGGQWQISAAGGITARWRHDGKELYYIAPDGQLMAVPIATQGATLEPGTPVALFQSRSTLGGNSSARGQYAVAPDGRFLINVTTGDSTSSPITLLLNWKPPAK